MRRRRMVWGCALLVLAGCSRHVQRAALPGDYVVAFGGERQTLQLRENGTYETVYYRGGKPAFRRDGRWSYQFVANMGGGKGEDAVTFEEFELGFSEYGRGEAPGFWVVVPEHTWRGDIAFCFDPDLNNRCFVRIAR